MKLNIKLGDKHPEYPSPCCGSDSVKDRVWYPELHITRKAPLEIPKEGTLTIRYKKIASSEREESYSCTIEVHEIVSAEGDEVDAPAKSDRSAEEALDVLAATLKKEKKY